MSKQSLLTCLIPFLLGISARDVQGCSCLTPEVPQAFREARAVFTGEVTEILEPRSNKAHAPLAERLFTIKFKVERSWKGATTEEILVFSEQGRGGCFSWGPFIKGKKYLVYAERRTPSGAPTKKLVVLFSCNRTAVLDKAVEDLKTLEILKVKTRSVGYIRLTPITKSQRITSADPGPTSRCPLG